VTPTSNAKDCTTDITCFLAYLKDCTASKVSYTEKIASNDFTVGIEITGKESDNCLVSVKFTKSPDTTITNAQATCKIPKGTYTQTSLETLLKSTDDVSKQLAKSYCTGTAVTNLTTYLITAKKTSDGTSSTIDVKTELEKLQKQRTEDMKIIQDLAATIKNQQSGTYSAAGSAVTATTAGVSTTTTSTGTTTASSTTNGATVDPGFKTNPYTVSMTPQQVLQANLSNGYVASAATSGGSQMATTTANTASTYTVKATTTPNSGPSEILMVCLLITFLAMTGWKFRKVFIV